MDNDKYRIPDYQGMIGTRCRGCAGMMQVSNGRATWLTCFADKKRDTCGGPYSMDDFLKMADKDD